MYMCAVIQCDLQMLLNVVVVVCVVIVGITDPFDQLIWFRVFHYRSETKEDIKTTITMHEWSKYHCDYTNTTSTRLLFLESMNMQIVYIRYACECVWVYELSHEWMKARSSSFFLSVCLQPRKSTLWAMKHVQQFTCNQIVCMRIDRERREEYLFNVYFFFVLHSHALSAMFNTFVILLLMFCCFFFGCLFPFCAYRMRRWKLQMTMPLNGITKFPK